MGMVHCRIWAGAWVLCVLKSCVRIDDLLAGYSQVVRIVHISDCYAPRLGGIETQVRALAMRQVAQGHDVHVITATPSPSVRNGSELLDGVQVHRVTARMPADLPVHPRVVKEVRAALGSGGVVGGADAVHVHGGVVSPFAYPAAKVARGLELPTVVTIHGVWGGVFSPLAKFADTVTSWTSWGVALTAVSDAAAEPIRRIVGPGVPVTLVPNGIDVDQWRVNPVAGDPRELRLVAVMRLAPRKRAVPLVQMAQRAARQLPAGHRIRLVVVGNGPLESRVRRAIDTSLTNCSVDLVGRLTPDAVRSTLASSDAFIAPALLESFGIAALEARTAGLPVLAYASTGISSFVRNGVEGLLASSDEQMVANIARLAIDGDVRMQIAEHNRTTEPVESWPNVLDMVQQAYARAAALA
jgi:glycosyltransferase involved in cell wall biosynthesis